MSLLLLCKVSFKHRKYLLPYISYFHIISSGSTCTGTLEHSFFCTWNVAIHITYTATTGPDLTFFSYSSLLILSRISAYTDKPMEGDSIENECIRQYSNYPSAKINGHSQLPEYQLCHIFVCSEKSISCHVKSSGLKIWDSHFTFLLKYYAICC